MDIQMSNKICDKEIKIWQIVTGHVDHTFFSFIMFLKGI